MSKNYLFNGEIMKILSIDTSGKSNSVSILDDQKVLGKIFLNCRLLHSQVIFKSLENLMSLTSTKFEDIDLFAVCNGPGSFTGIRIGLSLIKGISLVHNKPCIGVSSLLSLAYSCELDEDTVIYSCIEANKEEIYFNSYESINGDFWKPKFEDRFIRFSELKDIVKNEDKKIIFVGNIAELCYNLNIRFCKFAPRFYTKEVDSDFVGQAAYRKFLNEEEGSTSLLTANYLKKFKVKGEFSG